MSNTSKNFDLRELAGDLIGLVKDRAKDVASSAVKPDETRIQTAILSTIAEDSKNAAEITRAIALASAGTWSPSSGDIQKALTKLEAEKLISAKLDSDRKVYSATKLGKANLKAATDQPEAEGSTEPTSKLTGSLMACKPEFLRAASKLAPVMLDVAQTGSQSQQVTAAAVLEETRHKLHVILAEK